MIVGIQVYSPHRGWSNGCSRVGLAEVGKAIHEGCRRWCLDFCGKIGNTVEVTDICCAEIIGVVMIIGFAVKSDLPIYILNCARTSLVFLPSFSSANLHRGTFKKHNYNSN